MPSSPFLRNIHDFMAVRRYSPRTIKSYIYWIKYYIIFHNKQYPGELGPVDVEKLLTYLVVKRHVSSATQAVALNALVFLYKDVLKKPLGDIGQFRNSWAMRMLSYTHVLKRGAHGVRSPLSDCFDSRW